MSSRSAPRPHTRHPREHWASKNRMLTGSSKKGSTIGRNPNFDTEETKLLIQLWGDPKIQRTLITTHKKHVVILQLASKMRNYGYERSAEEITTRIKNLKCFYNRLKKEMECSENPTEPTWRHFADMDEIMTRPIFSVRPNEVPAPSLKYQLEQKKEERELRKRKALEEGRALSESDEDIEDIIAVSNVPLEKADLSDDGIIPDAEVDMEAADEAFAALVQATPKKRKLSKSTSEASAPYEEQDEQDEDDNRLLIKEEFENLENEDEKRPKFEKTSKNKTEHGTATNQQIPLTSNDDTNDSCVALIIPKDEPIDLDEDNDNDGDNVVKKQIPNMSASLGEMLKLTQNGMVAISSATGNILIPVSSVATTNASNNAAKLITTFSNTAISTAGVSNSSQAMKPGKISLVPTNFLMQSQAAQNAATVVNASQPSNTTKLTMPTQSLQLINGQMPNRFVLSGTQSANQAKAPSTGIVTTGPGGMKVLLVNAETTGAAGKICVPTNLGQNIVGSNAAIAKNTIGTVLPNINATKSQIQTSSPTTAPQALNQQQSQQEKTALKRKEEELLARKRRERVAQREELFYRREGTGMRNLLRTLLNVQTQNNELQRQRLNLERERLKFEKNVAERFFTVLPTLFAQQQQSQTQQVQPQPQQQFFNLLQQQSKTQQLRLNPTKLVFATGTLPSSSSTIVTPNISNVVSNIATSTTTIVNKIANDAKSTSEIEVNDVPLLTPKVEKED